ncbi:MAG: hypothetical protein IPL12_16455 [Bacteroidetes bacterium]|nr:hypothetical protein [Bacteroidota bacterium]
MDVFRYILVGLIAIIASKALTYYLNKAKPGEKSGYVILEMPKIYILVSIGLFSLFALTIYVLLFDNKSDINNTEFILFGLFGALIGFGGFNTLLLFTNHKVIYDDETIEVISWTGKKRKIHWSEVERISHSILASSMKIETPHTNVMIHEHIMGYKTFANILKKRTGMNHNK